MATNYSSFLGGVPGGNSSTPIAPAPRQPLPPIEQRFAPTPIPPPPAPNMPPPPNQIAYPGGNTSGAPLQGNLPPQQVGMVPGVPGSMGTNPNSPMDNSNAPPPPPVAAPPTPAPWAQNLQNMFANSVVPAGREWPVERAYNALTPDQQAQLLAQPSAMDAMRYYNSLGGGPFGYNNRNTPAGAEAMRQQRFQDQLARLKARLPADQYARISGILQQAYDRRAARLGITPTSAGG